MPSQLEQFGNPFISERLMRALDMKGDVHNVMARELLATVQSEDLCTPEFDFLRRRVRFAAGTAVPPVAGQLGVFAFDCALDNLIATVEKVVVVNPTVNAATFNVAVTMEVVNRPLRTVTGFPLDFRAWTATNWTGLSSVSGARYGIGSSAIAPAAFAIMPVTVPAGGTREIELPIVLGGKRPIAGTGIVNLTIYSDVVNTAFQVNVVWTEREVLSSEVA